MSSVLHKNCHSWKQCPRRVLQNAVDLYTNVAGRLVVYHLGETHAGTTVFVPYKRSAIAHFLFGQICNRPKLILLRIFFLCAFKISGLRVARKWGQRFCFHQATFFFKNFIIDLWRSFSVFDQGFHPIFGAFFSSKKWLVIFGAAMRQRMNGAFFTFEGIFQHYVLYSLALPVKKSP